MIDPVEKRNELQVLIIQKREQMNNWDQKKQDADLKYLDFRDQVNKIQSRIDYLTELIGG